MARRRSSLLVWGAGGHGRVVAEIARAAGYDVHGFIDADESKQGRVIDAAGARVILSEAEALARLRGRRPLPVGVDGIAPAVGDNRTRMDQVLLLGSLLPPALVHPSAVVSPSATLGRGAVVAPLAAVNAAARVGRGAIVNTGAVVGHDVVVEAGAHVSSGAVLTGAARVGQRALVGAGAVVLPGVAIGADTLVGAGAVVVRDLPDGARAAGIPARPIGESIEAQDMKASPREILLSPPHPSGSEVRQVQAALASNWLAPQGPQVDAFEREFAAAVGAEHAVSVNSGTAALHLALRLVGVGPGDDVLVSTLTFVASASPAVFLGARPVFLDSEPDYWNLDPALLAAELEARAARGRPPKAVVVVHLFGQCADLSSIVDSCARHGVPLIEDAAEALGATCHGSPVGTFGRLGVFSFNGNKMITTSGGGMLVGRDRALIERARWLAAQARDPATHYEHSQLGYNYGLSNILAAVGRAQLSALDDRVAARRRNARWYRESLEDLPGLEVQREAPWGRHARWLTCVTIDPTKAGIDRESVRRALEREHIEARPVWKPLHLQPVFAGCEAAGGRVAEDLFARGLCLPSGSSMSLSDLRRVTSTIRRAFERADGPRVVPAHRTSTYPSMRTGGDPSGSGREEAT